MKPLSNAAWLAWAIVVFLVPFLLQYHYMLNAFYYFGLSDLDSNQLLHVMWRNDWRFMQRPPFSGSFFALHFTPFLLCISLLSYLLPTYMVEFYATFLAIINACIALTVFYAFSCNIRTRHHWQLAGLALLSIAFVFNELIMRGMTTMHFEYSIPLGILLFMLCYARDYRLWTCILFIVTLSLREDAGFHLAAPLGLITAIKYWQMRSFALLKREIRYIAAAILYSLFALGITALVCQMSGGKIYGGFSSNFSMVYAGIPAYSHLSWLLLAQRLAIIVPDHFLLWLGFLATLAGWAYTRNPYLPIGYFAYIPWFIFNLTASHTVSGTFGFHYSFPFVVSLGWPLIAPVLRYGYPVPRESTNPTLILQAILIVIGLGVWGRDTHTLELAPLYDTRGGSYQLQATTSERKHVRDFIAALEGGAYDVGNIIMQPSVILLTSHTPATNPASYPRDPDEIDTFVYMHPPTEPFPNEVLSQSHVSALTHNYCVADTTLCLVTNASSAQLGTLAPFLSEMPLP